VLLERMLLKCYWRGCVIREDVPGEGVLLERMLLERICY
jgi:hypothetical protein